MTTPQQINKTIRLMAPSKTSTGKKDCTFCKPEGFKFLPLRYAVVCGVDAAHASMWPALAYPLGEGVADKKLVASNYTVRMLREGFVYVLVERKGSSPQWQAYAVTAGGMLASFPIGNPLPVPPVFTCDLATDGVGASFVAIERIEQVRSIQVLFSPDVLAVEILEQREKDRRGMQALPAHHWRGQPHVLAAQELQQWVAEFKLNTDGTGTISVSDPRIAGRAPFAQQLFPLMGGPGEKSPRFDPHQQRLTALVKTLEEMKSPAFVLWDPIGITQELNFRHRSLDVQLRQAMRPHEWELETSSRIVGLKQRVMSQAAIPPQKLPSNPVLLSKVGINPEYLTWQRDPQGWVKRNQESAWGRYASCYDEEKRAMAVRTVEAKLAPWFADVEMRFADLKAWLACGALTNAFEHYHPDNIECGLLFEYQASLCTYALATSKGGEALLREWARDVEATNANLLIRQMLFNQKAAIEEFRKAASKLKDKTDVDTTVLQQMVANTVGVMDKSNAIAQLAENGRVPALAAGAPAKLLGGALFVSTLGQAAFTTTSAAVDKLYAFVLYMRGGASAFLQGSADAVIGIFNASYPSQADVPIAEAQRQREALKNAMAANKSEFAAMRFGVVLAAIESWNLVRKYNAADGKLRGSRESWELYAACASTAAAISVSVANLSKVVKSASAWFEHLTLTSGMLGGFAAGVVAVESAADAGSALQDRRFLALVAFSGKSAMNGVAALGSLYVGLMYSAPLLQRIGVIIGESWTGRSVSAFGSAVARHAAAEVAIFGVKTTLRVGAEVVMGFIGWALIVEQIGELAILAVSDNPLQVWLTRCKFNKAKNGYGGVWGSIVHDKDAGNPYLSADEEMKAFDAALKRSLYVD